LSRYEIYHPNKGIIEEVIKRLVDRDPQLIERLGKHEVLLNWMGGFRVKGFYAAHEIAFDMPSIVGGSDAHPGPGPTLLASLGACLAIGVVYNSVVKDVKLHRLSVRIIGTKGDPRTFYIGSGGNPGYDNIHIIFYIETDASDEVMKNIIEHSIKTSPVASSLRARITYELKLLKKE
jgi:uncharacterized OsmC-like protein